MKIIVVGGGVAGLTAARDLVEAGHEVVVHEASEHLGGKLRTASVGGVSVDVGAEAMLARRPEGTALAAALGLTTVHPTRAGSRILSYGALRPMPRSLMGVPMDVEELAASGVLGDEGVARMRAEATLPVPPIGRDVSVGDLVAQRYGDEVVDRLVEPLLGGVYAGRARRISTRAAVPQLLTMLAQGPLTPQAAVLGQARSSAPVFAGLAGGMGGLPARLAADLDVRLSSPVGSLDELDAEAIVLATPARPTARLLRDAAPEAAALLGGVESATSAVVTFAFPAADVLDTLGEERSGFLVPPVEPTAIKASTFSFAKWDWVRDAGRAEGLVHLRTSLGRAGETLGGDDAELVEASRRDLETIAGLTAAPADVHVQRWVDGLPQYAVGHLDLVERVRADVARTSRRIAVCGAAYDGVGIPAVIGSAHRAAAEIDSGIMGS